MTECEKCGGMGGEPGSNFGDYGWHPCFACGATGFVPSAPEGWDKVETSVPDEVVPLEELPSWSPSTILESEL